MIKLVKNLFKKEEIQEIQQEQKYEANPKGFEDISPMVEYFKNETGVTFEKQISILKNKVTNLCKRNQISSFQELLKVIEHNSELKQELIDYLTTNETYFYREFKQIKELVELVRKSNRHVEILCAPCATGEEPYSIAIALLEAGIAAESFHILGIDINQDALNKAQIAVYRQRNVRNLSPEIIEKYFTHENNKYVLSRQIKKLVSFKLINIFDPLFNTIGKFDYIFSRNMLIYFDAQTKLRTKEILEGLRKDDSVKIFFGHADIF